MTQAKQGEAKRSEAQQKLFEASGKVELPGKLAAFFYLLMRDHVPPGKVGDLLTELRSEWTGGSFTNGWLAQYADYVAKELMIPPDVGSSGGEEQAAPAAPSGT